MNAVTQFDMWRFFREYFRKLFWETTSSTRIDFYLVATLVIGAIVQQLQTKEDFK